MKPRDQGTIVNVGSVVSYRAVPLQAPYSAAKYAVRGLTEALHAELIGERSAVRISIVHPPSVNTLFFSHAASHLSAPPRPPKPVAQPETIASAILLAATSKRREIKVTGSTVQGALGNMLMPGVLDWALGRFGAAAQTTDRNDARSARDPALQTTPQHMSAVHGPFDDEAHDVSGQMWMTRHRGGLATALGLIAIAAMVPGVLKRV